MDVNKFDNDILCFQEKKVKSLLKKNNISTKKQEWKTLYMELSILIMLESILLNKSKAEKLHEIKLSNERFISFLEFEIKLRQNDYKK